MTPAEYLALGRQLIPELLSRELAVPWIEAEARLSDAPWPGHSNVVEPHHLSRARSLLEAEGVIRQHHTKTRGARSVTLWSLTSPPRGQKAVERAAARKRLLTARYMGWAQGSPSRPGIVGPAGERVVHGSLLTAAPHGYMLAEPAGGGVRNFLGVPVPIGPLDNAAIRTVMTDGVPTGTIAVPVEVKNIRDWVYPSSVELYQLLDKAARLQLARPNVRIAPVLVCRRAHVTTMRMAKALGFFVHPTRRQYVGPTASTESVNEVRTELGLLDLHGGHEPDPRITRTFTTVLPKVIERTADLFAETAPAFGEYYTLMRTTTSTGVRVGLLREIKKEFREGWDLDFSLGW